MPRLTDAPVASPVPAEITCALGEHHACLTLNGPVTVSTIQRLVRQITLAFEYYQYEAVEIEIDSPGGELRALNYFLEHRYEWRQRGYSVRTRGVVTCASAAALLLAFGDPGERRIYRSTELLFHFSRVRVEDHHLTAEAASRLTQTLRQTDDVMLDSLVGHIADLARSTMAERLVWVESYMSSREVAAGWDTTRPHSPWLKMLHAVRGGPDETAGFDDRLREHLRFRFGQEQPMAHAEAYVLGLVDHVSGITPPSQLAD